MIDFNRKLDEIRQQPEHIRIRYVWGAVGISMAVIFTIWIFSIKASFNPAAKNQTSPVMEIKNQLEEQTRNIPSIGDFSPTAETGIPEGEGVQESTSNNNLPPIPENSSEDQSTE